MSGPQIHDTRVAAAPSLDGYMQLLVAVHNAIHCLGYHGNKVRSHPYCDVFGATGHKHVSEITDGKLVAEMVVRKELGKHVTVVTGL
jgi:hypothetical protein